MRNLFQGGECNPGGVAAGSNQFKAMMDMMLMGNQNPEKMVEYATHGSVNFDQEIKNRQMQFEKMKAAWAQQDQMVRAQGANMEEHFRMREAQHREMIEKIQQMEWARQQQRVHAERAMMEQHFRQKQMEHAMQMQHMEKMHQIEAQKMKALEQQFDKAQIAVEAENWKDEAIMDRKFDEEKVSYEEEQARIHAASTNMFNVMMEDSDPRFQNSQFLHFLKRIKQGDLVINGKTLTEVKPDLESKWKEDELLIDAQHVTMDSTFDKEKQKVQDVQMLMENAFQKAKDEVGNDFQAMYEQEWQRRLKEYEDEYKNTEQFEKTLEEKYMQVLKEMDLDLAEAWQGATDVEEQMVYGDARDKYVWTQDNPYLDVALPLPLAMDFISKGRNNDAILAMEAHLRKDQTDGERWRLLGKLLQENDQDQKSVPCFINALKSDPKNLDSLLCLGVSCTNILDEVKAMNYLKHWMINNPKYQQLHPDPNIIPDNFVNEPTYRIEDIKAINMKMIEMFEAAMRINQNDPDLLTSLAVLYFIKRDYEIAVGLFDKALKIDSSNYSLWNKVGATLAHLGKPDEAIKCYHKALDIKPNYVRVWVNLGIAHGYKGLYEEAARFYLNALSFRPNAKHIWSYLQTTFMSMQRYDLIKLIAQQDPSLFKQFDVMKVDDLPPPQIDYRLTSEQHLIGRQANQWVGEILTEK